MNELGQRLQEAITSHRRRHGRLETWVLLSCPSVTCSSMEVNIYVDETQPGVKPWQAPARCPRCGGELAFEEIEDAD